MTIIILKDKEVGLLFYEITDLYNLTILQIVTVIKVALSLVYKTDVYFNSTNLYFLINASF